MAKTPTNNPAGRLLEVLTAARKNSEKTPARKVWAQLAGVAPEDTGRILAFLADVIRQIQLAKEQLTLLENTDTELYLAPLLQVEKAFSVIGLDGNWQNFANRVPPDLLQRLAFPAERLSQARPKQEISNAELEKLVKAIEKLTARVLESDLEKELQGEIIRGLEAARQAILAYRIRGVEGLRDAIDLNVGRIFRNRAALTKKAKAIGEAWWDLILKMYTTAQLAGDLSLTLPETLDLLRLGDGP